MSYVLHVWDHAPAPTLQDALNQVSALSAKTGPQNPKFLALAQALTAVYPDMLSLDEDDEAEDGDAPPCVWVDSPMDGKTDAPVLVIGILAEHLSDHLRLLIAHTAADLGLQVLDEQAGQLYRPDRTVISREGAVETLPALSSQPAPSGMAPVVAIPSTEDTLRYLLTQFVETYQQDGWTLHDNNGFAPFWYAGRQIGQVTQKLRFVVSTGKSDATIGLQLGFVVPEIYEVIEQQAPKNHLWNTGIRDRKDKSEKQGAPYEDVGASLEELFPLPQLAELGFTAERASAATVHSMAELIRWSHTFSTWYGLNLREKLHSGQNLIGLNRLFDRDEFRDIMLRKGASSEGWLNHLMIAHLVGSPHIQTIADNLRRRADMALADRPPPVIRDHWLELVEVSHRLAPRQDP
ncbi:MAG: hypothetical protein ACRCTU_17995 [Zoogloea sp.]|uniref:hypothetical protein n=1 Tax=Zoogloea sp. TaxID=49181 RepID=UPI003F3D01D7